MKISVVVAVYNIEKYIKDCVESILAQDFDDFEVILVDDGSTDKSGAICDKFTDKRVKVIHQKNLGLSEARNNGLAAAKGDFIAFIDGDDTISEHYLSKLYDAARENKADIAVCGYETVYNDKVKTTAPKQCVLSGSDATWKLLTEQLDLDVLAWNKLYRRSLFTKNKISYPAGEKNEDNLTTYKLYAKAKRVCFIEDLLYSYLKRSDSITGQQNSERRQAAKEQAANEALEYLRGDEKLSKAARIALAWAKISWINYAIETKNSTLFAEKRAEYLEIKLGKLGGGLRKLALYRILLRFGWPYKVFRKLV